MIAPFDTNVLKQVATEIQNVKAEYGDVVSEESIDLVAGESLQKLAGSKVPQFVALFVGRFTRERLQELTGLRPHARFNLLAGGRFPPDQASMQPLKGRLISSMTRRNDSRNLS